LENNVYTYTVMKAILDFKNGFQNIKITIKDKKSS